MKLKALNFLQLWHSDLNVRNNYDSWLFETQQISYPNLSKWAYFLNQPFTPDLIEKYFEGWKMETISNYTRLTSGLIKDTINHNDKIYILEFYWSRTQYYYKLKDDKYSTLTDNFKNPRTLDEFITLAQLAGVELNLK